MITDFGASTNKDHINTAQIQSAIDQCAANGGGVVVIPTGTFLTGTLRLRSRVYLELMPGAVLLGSPNLEDYPIQPTPTYRSGKDQSGFRALLYAENEEGIALLGAGTIDGQGAQFKFGGNDRDGRPRLIQLVSCSQVRVENLQLRNSALWMQHYLNCEDVLIRGLSVWNHANHNNDMLDIDGCRRVTVADCRGDTDDDGITLKSTGPAACQDIAITNCVVSSHCNAIKCGTESTGGFRNITISNCTISPSRAPKVLSGRPKGISGISLEIVDGGTMDAVTISNIAMQGTAAPLFIRLGNRARKHKVDAETPPVGTLRNISIMNVVARDAGAVGCSISGIPGHPVENIAFLGVHIERGEAGNEIDRTKMPAERETAYPEATMFGGLPAYGFYLRHAKHVRFNSVVVVPHSDDRRPAFASEDVQNLQIIQSNFSAENAL